VTDTVTQHYTQWAIKTCQFTFVHIFAIID